ncbi:MAG: peptidylprolyl isomerase [Longimicrobiaceae bacterium]
MKRRLWLSALILFFPLMGCEGIRNALTGHTNVVARAADETFTVEEVAALLASNPRVPADEDAVRVVADLWIDYTLLVHAVREDEELEALDLEELLQPGRERALVWALRERVIRLDTSFSDEEVTRRWREEGGGVEVRARHILLRPPANAAPAARDSVRELAESLRARVEDGANFAALAREHSQDPGSASQGGELGWFGRGRMVEPFERASFSLAPGEVGVAESQFGVHLILVEDRRESDFTPEEREGFRSDLVRGAVQEAERAYLEGLTERVGVEISEEGVKVLREVAEDPDRELRSSRTLASWRGGELTAGETARFFLSQPPNLRMQVAGSSDAEAEAVLGQLAQNEVLVAEAGRQGVTLSPAQDDSIRAGIRSQVQRLVESSGALEVSDGGEVLAGVISGERPPILLGPLGAILRARFGGEVNESALSRATAEMEKLRAEEGATAPAPGVPPPAPEPGESAPDTTAKP